MKKVYNVGDITETGWEIVYVEYVPTYTMRKRIVLIENVGIKTPDGTHTIETGEKGYLYTYPDGRYKISMNNTDHILSNITIDKTKFWEEY